MYGDIKARISGLARSWLYWLPGQMEKRKNGPIVVVNVHGTGFYDNTKYFFSYLYSIGEDVYIISTERTDITEEVKKRTQRLFYADEERAKKLLLSAKVVVADRTDWMFDGRGALASGAFKLQLWHGIGLKSLERCYYRRQGLKGRLKYLLGLVEGRWVPYDLFVSTSDFFIRTWFFPCFFARRFESLGYPRNDILFETNDIPWDLAAIGFDLNALELIEHYREEGRKIIAYAPTYRKDFSNAFNKGVLDLQAMSNYAEREGVVWVIKMHPWEAKHTADLNMHLPGVVVYDGRADIQPLLKQTDTLITDYSSVYMDFLLTERSIIFFPYDREKIKEEDLYFSYDRFTPGPKVKTWSELKNILSRRDEWKTERRKLLKIAHKYQDGFSAQRIWYRVRGIVE